MKGKRGVLLIRKGLKTIIVNHGANDGEMTMIQLLPKQTQLIMR